MPTAPLLAKDKKQKKPSFKSFLFDRHNYYYSLEKMQEAIERKQRLTEFLRWVNLFLLGAIIMLALALVFDSPTLSQAESTFALAMDESDLDMKELIPTVKPLSYYRDPVLKRNIFQSKDYASETLKEKKEKGLSQLKTKLRVVGIILDDHPQVIIEKIKKGETAFVSQGETVESATVVDILEDKVIFLYNNLKLELSQ